MDAARGDLADIRLADRLFAPHYAAAVARTVIRRVAIRSGLSAASPALSEVLVGETFEVLELSGDRAWGVSTVDGSVGFISADALDATISPTHMVVARHAAAGDGGPTLPMGSRVQEAEHFSPDDLRPLSSPAPDYVALAEALVGVPLEAGGRSGDGVDATGLVFLVLSIAGIRAPRFLDLQAGQLGHAVDPDAPMLRGDLIFFADHVAIASDGDNVVHVAATDVKREPLAALLADGGFGVPTVRRRLP